MDNRELNMELGIYAPQQLREIENIGVDHLSPNIKHVTIQSNINIDLGKIMEIFHA